MDKRLNQYIRLAQQGDHQSFREIIIMTQEKAYMIAYKYSGNHEDAKDLLQEVYMKLWQRLRQFDSNNSFTPWLHSIIRNQAIDNYRKKSGVPVQSTPSISIPAHSLTKQVKSD